VTVRVALPVFVDPTEETSVCPPFRFVRDDVVEVGTSRPSSLAG